MDMLYTNVVGSLRNVHVHVSPLQGHFSQCYQQRQLIKIAIPPEELLSTTKHEPSSSIISYFYVLNDLTKIG